MTQSLRLIFLENQIGLLAEHFGTNAVRSAVKKVLGEDSKTTRLPTPSTGSHLPRAHKFAKPPTVAESIESLRDRDTQKHRLLRDFYKELSDKQVLPDPQDIRHFTQMVGLKGLTGKSRKELVPRLMFRLLDQPTDWLHLNLPGAKNISEHQRQQGFSVLTDKILNRC